MWVVARKSFFGYAGGVSMVIAENQVFDLPDGTDWVEAGLVAPLVPPASATPEGATTQQDSEPEGATVAPIIVPEVAAIAPGESTVLPTAKAKAAA